MKPRGHPSLPGSATGSIPRRPDDGAGPSSWWRRKEIFAGLAIVLAFLFGVGVGLGGPDGELDDALTQVALLTDELSTLEEQLAVAPSGDQVLQLEEENERYEDDIAELEEQLDSTQESLEQALEELQATPSVDELEDEIAELATALEDAESRAKTAEELGVLEVEIKEQLQGLERREMALAEQERSLAAAERAPPASGCNAEQVNINTAGTSELQRIHQVGPARAQQIVQLRPFGSVDELTRVSGVGSAHLSAIKGQGVACVE